MQQGEIHFLGGVEVEWFYIVKETVIFSYNVIRKTDSCTVQSDSNAVYSTS